MFVLKPTLARLSTVILLVCGLSQSAHSAAAAKSSTGGRNFGLGAILGSPTAITAKHWANNRDAFDAGVSFALYDYFLIYGDYLYHFAGALGSRTKVAAALYPYVGIGGLVVFTTKDRGNDEHFLGRRSGTVGLGMRIPLGIEWRPGHPPLGVYFELAPGISIIPATSAFIQGGIGIRYYF